MTRFLIATAIAALFAGAAQAAPAADPDTNRDGKVTQAEFKAMSAQRQERLFARLDTDKDGKITQAEIDAAGKRAEAKGRKGGGMLMRLDVDKDGAVSRAEMAVRADRRFQMTDTNKDGWLSKDELLKMRERRGAASAQ